MKHLLFLFSLMLSITLSAQKTGNFTVHGNCGMCKEKIEKAANDLEGVQSADWSSESKEITMIFNEAMVSLDDIKKAIAATGYDTDTHRATKEAYDGLHGCCKYERPASDEGAAHNSSDTKTTFAVSGNCGGCKKRIETAAASVKGVQSASWDAETQQITVLHEAGTKLSSVKKAIAKVGHDTDGFKAKDKVYNKLNACCQYERVLN